MRKTTILITIIVAISVVVVLLQNKELGSCFSPASSSYASSSPTIIIDKTTWTTKEDNNNNNNDNTTIIIKKEEERRTALIHMGPHKTGSSSLQHHTMSKIDLLLKDGYMMPWAQIKAELNQTTNKFDGNQVKFAGCFDGMKWIRDKRNCDGEHLIKGLEIGRVYKSNLLITAENFAQTSINGYSELATYLESGGYTDIIIVVVYRRYYNWLASFYNQIHKWRGMDVDNKENKRLWEKSVLDYITTKLKWNKSNRTKINQFGGGQFVDIRYTYEIIQRLSKISMFQNQKNRIQIIDYHSVNDVAEELFCYIMPITNEDEDEVVVSTQSTINKNNNNYKTNHNFNMCNAIREEQRLNNQKMATQQTSEGNRDNASKNLDYSDLVYGAIQHFQNKQQQHNKNSSQPVTVTHLPRLGNGYMTKMVPLVQRYYLQLQNESSYEFPRRCLPNNLLTELWELSLMFERELVLKRAVGRDGDDDSYSSNMEEDLRKDFELASTTILCSLDVEAALQQDTWKHFFVL